MQAPATDTILGLHRDLPADEYHAGPGVSCGHLEAIGRSPLHYKHRGEVRPTGGMARGSLGHTALLEPLELDERYAVVPEGVKRNKTHSAYKKWLEEECGDREPVLRKEYDEAVAMAARANTHPVWRRLIDSAEAVDYEVSGYWEDERTGILCRLRADVLIDPGKGEPLACIDIKTMANAEPGAAIRQAATWDWPRRAAWYSDGIKAITGRGVDWLAFCLEYTPPYDRSLIPFSYANVGTPSYLIGRAHYRDALTKLVECQERDSYPGYNNDELVDPELPSWYARELENIELEDPF